MTKLFLPHLFETSIDNLFNSTKERYLIIENHISKYINTGTGFLNSKGLFDDILLDKKFEKWPFKYKNKEEIITEINYLKNISNIKKYYINTISKVSNICDFDIYISHDNDIYYNNFFNRKVYKYKILKAFDNKFYHNLQKKHRIKYAMLLSGEKEFTKEMFDFRYGEYLEYKSPDLDLGIWEVFIPEHNILFENKTFLENIGTKIDNKFNNSADIFEYMSLNSITNIILAKQNKPEYQVNLKLFI